MWVFLNNAFVSIVVDHRDPENTLLCRARKTGDLKRAFGPHTTNLPREEKTPLNDYLYRMSLPREVVANALARHAEAISYGNFKNSIPKPDHERHSVYSRVWGVMVAFQDKVAHRRGRSQLDLLPPMQSAEDFEDEMARRSAFFGGDASGPTH